MNTHVIRQSKASFRLNVLFSGLLTYGCVIAPVMAKDNLAKEVNWQAIPPETISLFYPAQASWQYLASKSHPGSAMLNNKAFNCKSCHRDQQQKLGESLVKHPRLEPDPIQGKSSLIKLKVQAAFDDTYLHMKFEWPSKQAGITHTQWRYDGQQWQSWGGAKPDVSKKDRTASYEDRLAVILGVPRQVPAYTGAEVGFSEAGCFISCHNSMRKMPEAPTSQQVKAHAYFGDEGKKRKDIRKYLLLTRSGHDTAGMWDHPLDESKLTELFHQGRFLDLWQWRASRSNPLGHAGDDYVFEYRWFDKGNKLFFKNKKAAWIYDQSVTGFNAIPEKDLESRLNQYPLIKGQTAKQVESSDAFKEGDILPQIVLQTPTESVADVQALGEWRDGKWSVILKRKLDTGQKDDIAMQQGKVYDIGLAVFDDHVSNRRHYVNLPPLTIGIGVKADIKALRK